MLSIWGKFNNRIIDLAANMSNIKQNQALQLAVEASSIPDATNCEDLSNDTQKEIKKTAVGQMKVPVYMKPHFWSPDFVKCDGKIIKYDLRALGIWRVSSFLIVSF